MYRGWIGTSQEADFFYKRAILALIHAFLTNVIIKAYFCVVSGKIGQLPSIKKRAACSAPHKTEPGSVFHSVWFLVILIDVHRLFYNAF